MFREWEKKILRIWYGPTFSTSEIKPKVAPVEQLDDKSPPLTTLCPLCACDWCPKVFEAPQHSIASSPSLPLENNVQFAGAAEEKRADSVRSVAMCEHPASAEACARRGSALMKAGVQKRHKKTPMPCDRSWHTHALTQSHVLAISLPLPLCSDKQMELLWDLGDGNISRNKERWVAFMEMRQGYRKALNVFTMLKTFCVQVPFFFLFV